MHPLGSQGQANPGLAYLLAVNFRVFGDGVVWPVVALMNGLGLAILWLNDRLVALHADRGLASLQAWPKTTPPRTWLRNDACRRLA